MASTVVAEWEGREYEPNPRSADWYWVLGIVAVAGAIVAILFGAFLIAILIIAAAAAVALHARKEPPVHTFRLTDQGLFIGPDLHPFDRMVSFSMLEDIDGELPPILSLRNETWHSPHLHIPLDGADADLVYAYLLAHVDEDPEDHRHTLVDLVAAWLGF